MVYVFKAGILCRTVERYLCLSLTEIWRADTVYGGERSGSRRQVQDIDHVIIDRANKGVLIKWKDSSTDQYELVNEEDVEKLKTALASRCINCSEVLPRACE